MALLAERSWGPAVVVSSGAHILTIPPNVLSECLLAARTKETVSQFLADAEKVLEEDLVMAGGRMKNY